MVLEIIYFMCDVSSKLEDVKKNSCVLLKDIFPAFGGTEKSSVMGCEGCIAFL
jgi:hypothetical protein